MVASSLQKRQRAVFVTRLSLMEQANNRSPYMTVIKCLRSLYEACRCGWDVPGTLSWFRKPSWFFRRTKPGILQHTFITNCFEVKRASDVSTSTGVYFVRSCEHHALKVTRPVQLQSKVGKTHNRFFDGHAANLGEGFSLLSSHALVRMPYASWPMACANAHVCSELCRQLALFRIHDCASGTMAFAAWIDERTCFSK